jgi:ABC-type transport system involved in multi-copper enzyme maturation permease subunit
MKFLAILKDSFREAIDAKVFYVMVGLSVLLALLALAVSFEPQPGGQRVVEDFAVLPLNADASNLNEAETARVFLRNSPVSFAVDSVKPLDGAPDAPSSSFQVVLKASYRTPAEAQQAKDDPAAVEQLIRDKFGLIEGKRMMEAADVHFVEWKGDVPSIFDVFGLSSGKAKELTGTFRLTAKPTDATWRFWPNKFGLFFGAYQPFGAAPLYQQVFLVEDLLVGYLGSGIAVLISVVITAFFIPNMLRKGSVDLLLVKPIHRVVLLVYKYIGGLTFIFLNTAVAVGGVWLALGLRSGIWAVSFLETILVLTFFFAILYSASTLFGVVTRSPIAAILLTCGLWAFMLVVGWTQSILNVYRTRDRYAAAVHKALGDEGLEMLSRIGSTSPDADAPPEPGGKTHRRLEDFAFPENWFTQGVSFLHAVLPRTSDLYSFTGRQLQHDLMFGDLVPPEQKAKVLELPGGIKVEPVEDKPSLAAIFINSGAFIAVMLALACAWFAMKDY